MTLAKYRKLFFKLFGQRWGLELSPVSFNATGERYLDRYILYLGPINLRLHKFYRGDDLRAPHDHPWWFITFPFSTYYEQVEFIRLGRSGLDAKWVREPRVVKAFRFHYRPARYRHIVYGRFGRSLKQMRKPFWTFVIAGSVSNAWGFWPAPTTFVPWREWK